MKDLPMFNKLFFALCSTLMIALTSPSAAEEPTYHTIQGSGGEYEVFGTKQEALNTKDKLTNETWVNNNRIISYQNQRAKYNASDETTEWINGKYVSQHELWDYKIAAERAKIKAAEQKIIAPMGEEREKKYKAQKIADAKAKLIEDARLAKIAADKVLEDARLAKIAADRLAKIAADKVIEDARLAKIAADKVIEDARLATIAAAKKKAEDDAAAKKIEDERLAKIAADKVIEDARLATIAAAKKKAEDDAYREKERKRLAEELKKQQAYAYKVKMEGEPLEKRLEDPVFAKKYKEDRIKLGWMLERKQRKEEAARIKEVIRKQRLKDMISIVLNVAGNIGAKDPNKITTITKDGQVRTLYCNPGPCTPGSVKLHENISGLEMGVDINTLAKRIETNAAQRKRQDNTNENNAKTAEDIASLGNVSLDTLFEQSEADLDETNDISLTRALSIPKNQVEKNKEAYKDSVKNSHKNSHKNKEAETDYVKNADEIKQYCLYEGC
jgi:hypothetical protein